MNSGIYEIVNTVNGHRYIGSAVNIPKRWRDHKRQLINNKHHSRYLQSAWNKYGADCFEFRVIEYCFFFLLIAREQYYIDDLRPVYNISPTAGSTLGVKCTPEQIAKNSAARMGNKYALGRKHTPESKAKMSVARKGEKKPPMTAETKAKISAAHIGKKRKPITAETRAKLSAAGMGNQNTLGRKFSPEQKAILSASITAWWVRRKQQEAVEA